ncbi:2Fe-2S iron-sulfur cluster-binding protein [Deinococcus roseus]|uniref:Ferredoxin n=1 Tax=Deinococcus roseus TaxID=392414 RepID=A0ABQ2DCS3_9DEIO|nr:2Fe-2S iron-sulfur cluster-binding protein [Deinococcus roseus]GGJ53845.1 ferredoxin [Deinococcus roseus]
MPKITVEQYGTFEIETGKRLVLGLEDAGVDMLHRCGGKARCTTCMVEVLEGTPTPMTMAEKTVLEAKGLAGQGRLSCQITCESDLTLRTIKTTRTTGLEPGTHPAEHIEPDPEYLPS